jgi:undecaprenyl-diphosphatase
VVGAAAAFVALALGGRYAGEAYPRWLDLVGLTLARDWFPISRGAARLVIGVFDPVPLAVLVVVLAGTCLFLGRRRLAVLAVTGPVGTGLVTTVLKPVVDRTKDGDLAYPSGHMGAAVALALVVALLVVGLTQVRGWTAVAVLAGAPVVTGVIVGVAMTVADYHYLTDAVGGFCVAVAVVLSLTVLLDRRRPRRPANDHDVGMAGNTARPVCD